MPLKLAITIFIIRASICISLGTVVLYIELITYYIYSIITFIITYYVLFHLLLHIYLLLELICGAPGAADAECLSNCVHTYTIAMRLTTLMSITIIQHAQSNNTHAHE